MKKKNIIWGALAIMLCTACSEDKGNYDYTDFPEVYINPDAKNSFVVNLYDYLNIPLDVKFTRDGADEDDYSYRWVIYHDRWSKDGSEIQEISTDRNLHYQITQSASADPYAVVLYLTNKQRGTTDQIKYSVTVHATISSGILALYETTGGSCDFDYIATPNAVPTLETNVRISNALSVANPEKRPEGMPILISAVRENRTVINHVYVCTDKEMVQLSGIDFTQTAGFDDLFYSRPSVWNPQSILRDGYIQYATVMVNGDEVHCINKQTSPNYCVEFSDALQVSPSSSLDAVEATSWLYVPNEYNYPVGEKAVFYDKQGKRFVRLLADYYGSSIDAFPIQKSGILFDVNNVGKDCCWLGHGYNHYGYALFKDGETYEMYCADFNMPAKIYDSNTWSYVPVEEVNNLAFGLYDLSSMPEIANAKFFDCGRYAPVFLYATERNIYACALGSNSSATQINNAFASDEVITGMMVYNPNTATMSALNNVAGTLLYVSTWNGTEGKLYEFAIARNSCLMNNTNGEDKKAPLNVFGGMGRIVSICVKLEGLG
jgi:hypothetical protein